MKDMSIIKRVIVAVCLMALTLHASAVKLDDDNFPDESFRGALCLILNVAPNSELSDELLKSVKTMNLKNKGISRLKGIQYFSNLEELDVSENDLNNLAYILDLSQLKKLLAANNRINKLPVTSFYQRLEYLDLKHNSLSSLYPFPINDFRNLQYLDCSYNHLTEIDFSRLFSLKDIRFNNNEITTAVTPSYPYNALEKIDASNNQLTSIDTEKLMNLRELRVTNNKNISFDVSKNTALQDLQCAYCGVSTLDLTNNTQLWWLYCAYNTLEVLDLTAMGNLRLVACDHNNLTQLQMPTSAPYLYRLSCGYNNLTKLDVSGWPALEKLECQNNKLTTLDLSKNTQLTDLSCAQKFSLDVYRYFNGKYLMPVKGVSEAFNMARFTNLTSDGVAQDSQLQCGYLVVERTAGLTKYDFDTGNGMTMHVDVDCRDKGMIQTVNRVDITGFDWPEDFTPADYEATSSTSGCQINFIEYIWNRKLYPDYVGTTGESLEIRFNIELEDGYIYGDPSAYIGDAQNNVCLQLSKNERIKDFAWTYTVPTPPGGLYVRSIRETIAEPEDGAHPSFQTESMMAGVKPPSTKDFAKPVFIRHYTVDQVIWLEMPDEDEAEFRIMQPSDVFKQGYYYGVIMLVSPKAGYQFSPNTVANINGDLEGSGFLMDIREETEGFLDLGGAGVMRLTYLEIDPTAIHHPVAEPEAPSVKGWYSLDGRKLDAKPTQKGIYVKDGRKVIVR